MALSPLISALCIGFLRLAGGFAATLGGGESPSGVVGRAGLGGGVCGCGWVGEGAERENMATEADEASGYYMNSGGMLVCGGGGGGGGMEGEGYGEEEEQVLAAGEVHQMRRDLSGEAFEWVPQSQSSDEALSQQQPAQAYEHQAYEHQAYAGGFGGGTFGSGAWGSGGSAAAAAAADEGSAEWGDDAIVLEPAHPFDEWNFGGTVAVHTRCDPG